MPDRGLAHGVGHNRPIRRRRRELAPGQGGKRLLGVDLGYGSIVGQQSVALGFHVGDLGVDGGGKAALVAQLPHVLPKLQVLARQCAGIGHAAVAPALADPAMTVQPEPETAELAQDRCPRGSQAGELGPG